MPMENRSDISLAGKLKPMVHPFDGAERGYDSAIDLIDDSQVALLGSGSHGTREFYRSRAAITQRLIEQKRFVAVAVEADWAPARRVDRYVAGVSEDTDAIAALGDFEDFPAWMWRNREVADFIEWLKSYNDRLPARSRVRFYGLDLFDFGPAIDAVLAFLESLDPAAADRARDGYACLDAFRDNPRGYSTIMASELIGSCKAGAARGLVELYESDAVKGARRAGTSEAAAAFEAEQNARVVKAAEEYYRLIFRSEARAWNTREHHMADTIDDLIGHLDPRALAAKIAVWAHNAHVGDARGTDMREDHETSVGALMRERYNRGASLLGSATHHGAVLAARDWDAPAAELPLPPASADSYEALFHATGVPQFFLSCREGGVRRALTSERRERRIGVVYNDDYLVAKLSRQFDGLLHFDETRGTHPLEGASTLRGAARETFPFGV